MPVFNQCCCCSLKAGCKTLASIAIILNILVIALGAGIIALLFPLTSPDVWPSSPSTPSTDPRTRGPVGQFFWILGRNLGGHGPAYAAIVLIIISVAYIVFSVISLIVYSCLIHGVNHRKDCLVLPALVFIPLQAIIFLAGLIVDAKVSGLSAAVIGFIIGITFYILIWLVVLSSWQEIREEKRGAGAGNRGMVNHVYQYQVELEPSRMQVK